MKIKDVLQRDPDTFPLVNQGQARIVDSHNAKALEELRGELSTFVCEGQYADGVQRIIRSYLDSLGKTNQKAAWVSGFLVGLAHAVEVRADDPLHAVGVLALAHEGREFAAQLF